MTEEVKIELKVEEPKQEEVVPTPVEVSPVETEARDQGWVSKEEWVESGRSETDWKTAKDFIKDGEFIKTISGLKREQKQTQAALDALQRHHKFVFEKAHAKAVEDLKLERRAALRADDIDAVEAIEEKMQEVNTEYQRAAHAMAQEQAQIRVGPPQELVDFVHRNPWYQNDPDLRDEADALGFIYLNKGGEKSGMLAHVERKIKAKFPEKFGAKRAAPNAVAAPNRSGGKAKGDDGFVLSDTEMEIARTFERQGVMSVSDYKKELKRAKERS
jgi:hypothetical protein